MSLSLPERAGLASAHATNLQLRRQGRALAIVSTLGALGGGAIGTVLLAAIQTRAPGGFNRRLDIPSGLVFGGSFGALVGALGGPLFGWCFFRHVPLGRAMVITSIGTIGGALVGLVAGRDPVVGGVLGFAITGAALRYHPRAG